MPDLSLLAQEACDVTVQAASALEITGLPAPGILAAAHAARDGWQHDDRLIDDALVAAAQAIDIARSRASDLSSDSPAWRAIEAAADRLARIEAARRPDYLDAIAPALMLSRERNLARFFDTGRARPTRV